MTTFLTDATSTIALIKEGLTIATTAPLSYFIALGFAGVAVRIGLRFIPKRKG